MTYDCRVGTSISTSASASTGSACHEGHEEAPAVIVAMGVPRQEALGTERLSLGRGTTRDAVERAATALAKSWRALVPAVVS
jgi:cysteine desulfurase